VSLSFEEDCLLLPEVVVLALAGVVLSYLNDKQLLAEPSMISSNTNC
jgi:hypothetical protein